MPAKKTAAPKRKTTRKTTRRRGPAEPRGPEPGESALDPADRAVADLAERVRRADGAVLAAFKDPYASSPLVLASLPLKAVEPTPFQRDLSRTHAQRLVGAIGAAGLFLDPVIAVPAETKRGDGGGQRPPPSSFWSPNGRHRLAAAKQLGLRSVTALIVTDEAIAYRTRGRFSGSSYTSMLRRVDRFLDVTLPKALRQREQWAQRIMDIDDRVAQHVKALQEMGFKSPYLRQLVVARCNPVRWIPLKRGETKPPMPLAEALTRMAASVRRFEPRSVRAQDLALVAAVAPSEE